MTFQQFLDHFLDSGSFWVQADFPPILQLSSARENTIICEYSSLKQIHETGESNVGGKRWRASLMRQWYSSRNLHDLDFRTVGPCSDHFQILDVTRMNSRDRLQTHTAQFKILFCTFGYGKT